MPKIAFIGAGSLGFTRGLVRDILTFPQLRDADIALMDIDRSGSNSRAGRARRSSTWASIRRKSTATLDRAEALKGADAVLCTILAGGVNVWQHDIVIPKKYGVDINVGDTRGPSGIFRALRTIPVMLDICRDMERFARSAILLNYTNPMAMLCRAMQRTQPIQRHRPLPQRAGHGGDAGQLDRRADGRDRLHLRRHQPPGVVPRTPSWNGKDAYPRIRKAVARGPKIYNEEAGAQRDVPAPRLLRHRIQRAQLRVQLVVPQAARPDREILHHGTGWNPGVYALHPEAVPRRAKTPGERNPRSGWQGRNRSTWSAATSTPRHIINA